MKIITSIIALLYSLDALVAQGLGRDECLLEVRTALPPGIANAYCTPYVVNPAEAFSISIQLHQDGYKSIQLKAANWGTLLYKNASPVVLVLNDDGMNGDLKAGDRVFTVNQLTTSVSPSIFYPTSLFYRNMDVTFTTTLGVIETQNLDLPIGIRIIPNFYTLPIVKSISATAQMTDYVLNLVLPQSVIDDQKAMAKEYYKYLPDDRDFIVRSTTYPTAGAPAAANFFAVKNQTTGLSIPSASSIFDRTSDYGSKGKLLGFINMFFTHGGETILLNHELLHNWAVYVDPDLMIHDGPHWTYVLFPSSGFSSGRQIASVSLRPDSTYLCAPQVSGYYNSLELYLMGLHAEDSIQFPIVVPSNPVFITNAVQNFIIKASGIKNINKAEFFTKMPRRNPSFATAQHEFKVGSMVISDRLLTPKELSYFHEIMKDNESKNQSQNLINANYLSFNTATRNKGSLITKLPSSTPLLNKPDEISFDLYPNPGNGSIYIKGLPLKRNNIQYLIMTVRGDILASGRIQNEHHVIALSHTPGIYFLKLIDGNMTGVKKYVLR